MKSIINWFIEPYQIIRSEFHYLIQLKNKETISKKEKLKIYQLQYFNGMLFVLYSLFFIAFLAYSVMIFIVNWIALAGVIVGLVMMIMIKLMQKAYIKRREAFIKDDPRFIKQ